MERLRALRDDLGLEVADEDLLGEEEVAEDGGVKVLEDALVHEAEVVVAPLDHRGPRVGRRVARRVRAPHPDGVTLRLGGARVTKMTYEQSL